MPVVTRGDSNFFMVFSSFVQEFTWADRNAPLPLKTGEKRYSWDEAVVLVAEGYKRFSTTLHDLFTKQTGENRIHASAKPGKKPGAYCCGVAPGVGPFQLDNFVVSGNGFQRSFQLLHFFGVSCFALLFETAFCT